MKVQKNIRKIRAKSTIAMADCVNVLRHVQHSLQSLLAPIDFFMLSRVARDLVYEQEAIPSWSKHAHMYKRYIMSGICFVHTYVTPNGTMIIKRSPHLVSIHYIKSDSFLEKEQTRHVWQSCPNHVDEKIMDSLLEEAVWGCDPAQVLMSCFPRDERFLDFRSHCTH